jgi:ribosomal protein S18 acetylase RimI-like enzyme
LSVELRPVSRDDAGWLADLHNRAFADYPVPAVLDAAALRSYMDETDVSADASVAAFVDSEPASFCLGAIRGSRGSIRGEGTDPRFRRLGLGTRVLQATLDMLAAQGVTETGLEVLDGNLPAIALYESAGFERVRTLIGFTIRRPPRLGLRARRTVRLEALSAGEAIRRVTAWGWPEAPWQLEPASLAHLPAVGLDDVAVVVGRPRDRRFWLYAVAVDPDHRRRGLATRALAGLGADWIAVPAVVPDGWREGIAWLESLGAQRESYSQWEMRLRA